MRDVMLAVATVLAVGGLVIIFLHAPPCRPGDQSIYIGNMLVAGCPR